MFVLISGLLSAQHEAQSYVPETDPLVLEKLDQWKDMKFGLLMHWGAYSQWGIVESWSICPEDYGWCERKKGAHADNYFEYVREYEQLKNTFNPAEFDPQKWAGAAADAGMKYVVFTTKHHDGFCMFDSKYTDYKVTDTACPFHTNPNSNITRAIFEAFRAEGLWAGAYFSKPDWHSDDYWDPYFPPRDRNVNYDPELYPEKWEKYVQFTHNQILELLTDYGKVDILWLDGGWVAKENPESVSRFYQSKLKESNLGFIKSTIVNQDIRMDELVVKAREKQPGLIVVDRAVPGKNQNYLTPENRVPEEMLPYPWESCIIAGGGWSWVPDAQYMTARKAIHTLVDIVAKGGNLLYNIAPGPDGRWHEDAYSLLEQMGKWIAVNGEAIYGSKTYAPYKTQNICFTQQDDGTVYAIYLAKAEEVILPASVHIASILPEKNMKVQLLGWESDLLWEEFESGIRILIPSELQDNQPCEDAWVFKFSF